MNGPINKGVSSALPKSSPVDPPFWKSSRRRPWGRGCDFPMSISWGLFPKGPSPEVAFYKVRWQHSCVKPIQFSRFVRYHTGVLLALNCVSRLPFWTVAMSEFLYTLLIWLIFGLPAMAVIAFYVFRNRIFVEGKWTSNWNAKLEFYLVFKIMIIQREWAE